MSLHIAPSRARAQVPTATLERLPGHLHALDHAHCLDQLGDVAYNVDFSHPSFADNEFVAGQAHPSAGAVSA